MNAVVFSNSRANPKTGQKIVSLRTGIAGATSLSSYHSPADLDKSAISWLEEWSDKPLLRGKNFRELLEYQGESLYWLLLPSVYIAFRDAVAAADAVHNLLQKEKPSLVVFECGNAPERGVIESACRKRGIRFEATPEPTRSDWLARLAAEAAATLKEGARCALGKAFKAFSPKGARVILLSHSRTLRPDSEGNRADHYVKPVARELERRGVQWKGVDADYSLTGEWRSLFVRLANGWLPVEAYYTPHGLRGALAYARKAEALWRELNENKEFKASFACLDSDIYSAVKPRLNHAFSWAYLYRYPLYFNAFRNLLNQEKPAALAAVYETGPYGRAAITACRKAGVSSFGIQHGIIHSSHPDYAFNAFTRTFACPVPCETLVYGAAAKRVLVEHGHFPAGRVCVTGNPANDELVRCAKRARPAEFRRRLGLPKDKPLLLFTSSWAFSPTHARQLAEVFREVASGAEKAGFALLVKLHPLEDAALAKKCMPNAAFTRDALLAECLASCDAFATWNSTTAVDAMILKKPVLIVNLSGEPDVLPFVESGCATGVYSRGALASALAKAVKGKAHVEAFVREQAFKVDGHSAERIAAEIAGR
ncbi:MAG: CDP-glycerol glycerophosphotransferase family protein [Candidatus Micrarchaeia archaeon]